MKKEASKLDLQSAIVTQVTNEVLNSSKARQLPEPINQLSRIIYFMPQTSNPKNNKHVKTEVVKLDYLMYYH